MNLPQNANVAQQREILDALPVLVFLERAGRIVFANAEARRLIGLDDAEWRHCPVDEVIWGLLPGTAEPQTMLTGSRSASPFHATLTCKGGRMTPVEGTYNILNPELGEGIIVAHASGRERAPKPRLMDDVLASIPEAVAIVHGSHVLYTNPAFTRLFGYAADELIGRDLRDFIVPETRQHENLMLQRALEEYGRASVETVCTTKGGDLVDVALQAAPLLVNGARAGFVLTYRDIGERKLVEAQLQHDAMHDVLTGLPNLPLFQDRLRLAFNRRLRRRDQGCGLLFVDLDHFSDINAQHGHACGDMLLRAVGERLRAILRPHDTAARIAGDEFAIVVENILAPADLDVIAKRVLQEVDRPFELLGKRVQITASLGVALAGPDHNSPDQLIRDADAAMYRAKQEGGHRYELFDRRTGLNLPEQQKRERELRGVLARHEFEFWYQPIFRLATGFVEGFETLLRWRRPDGSVEGFRDLLPVAEDAGLLIGVGRDSLEAACRQLHSWIQAIPGNSLAMNVNITHRQFYHDDLIAQVKKVLDATGADPSRLMLEVSESTVNENPDRAVAILQRLADCGVHMAIDNFGAHLAPINHLLRLPMDLVKLDPSLSEAVTGGPRQVAMLEALIHVCKAVGVQVLAQGIETHEQLRMLQELGCDLGQGHLLSQALDPDAATDLASRTVRVVAP